MTSEPPRPVGPRPPEDDRGGDDPWAAFGYLVAGVGVYGFLGWALGRWLSAPYLAPLGIVVGAAFGIYLVFARFARAAPPPHNHNDPGTNSAPGSGSPEGTDPSTDHRGEAE